MRAGSEYFLEPGEPVQRRYEALRSYFVDGASEVRSDSQCRDGGYSTELGFAGVPNDVTAKAECRCRAGPSGGLRTSQRARKRSRGHQRASRNSLACVSSLSTGSGSVHAMSALGRVIDTSR